MGCTCRVVATTSAAFPGPCSKVSWGSTSMRGGFGRHEGRSARASASGFFHLVLPWVAPRRKGPSCARPFGCRDRGLVIEGDACDDRDRCSRASEEAPWISRCDGRSESLRPRKALGAHAASCGMAGRRFGSTSRAFQRWPGKEGLSRSEPSREPACSTPRVRFCLRSIQRG